VDGFFKHKCANEKKKHANNFQTIDNIFFTNARTERRNKHRQTDGSFWEASAGSKQAREKNSTKKQKSSKRAKSEGSKQEGKGRKQGKSHFIRLT
jgi:hypothetical protein